MDIASTSGDSLDPKRQWLRLPQRLPNLKGKWLTFYTIAWAILLPLSLLGAVKGTYIAVTTPTMWSPYGFSTTEDSQGLHVDVVSTPAARAAGLKAGDYVVAVDGWRVPRTAARAAAREHVIKPDGASTSFTLRRPSGDLYTIRLVRDAGVEEAEFRAAGMSRSFARMFSAITAVAVPVMFLSAAILLFLRRRREAVPALLSLSFLLFASTTNSSDLLGISLTVVNIVGVSSACLLFAALFAFPSGRFDPRWTSIPFLLCPVFLVFAYFPDAVGVASLLGAGFFLLVLVALIVRYRKLPAGAERQQLRWAFFGLSVGAAVQILGLLWQVAGITWQAQDPRWSLLMNLLGALSFIAMTLGLMISILRYRLYDADAVIGRSAAYGVLTLGFVALFAGSEKLVELIGERYFEHQIGIAAGAIGAAAAAVCIVPLHNRVHAWAERRFQKALIRLREGLPQCVGDLRESASVKPLLLAVMARVEAGVRSRSEAILLAENGKLTIAGARGASLKAVREWKGGWQPAQGDETLNSDRHDAAFPIRVRLCVDNGDQPETIGWLLLGPRPDGSFFGKDEREALEAIAGPVARAIHIAQIRERREAEAEKRLSAMEALIEKLNSALDERKPKLA